MLAARIFSGVSNAPASRKLCCKMKKKRPGDSKTVICAYGLFKAGGFENDSGKQI